MSLTDGVAISAAATPTSDATLGLVTANDSNWSGRHLPEVRCNPLALDWLGTAGPLHRASTHYATYGHDPGQNQA